MWFLDAIGPSARGSVDRTVVDLPDGSTIALRGVVIRGQSDGPKMYIGAAIHGDEVCGIEVMRRLARAVDPSALRGVLVMVPVQNPVAFGLRQRFLPAQGFDVHRIDMFHTFPGSPHGEIAHRLAHTLLEWFIKPCDYAFDLHTALAGSMMLDYAYGPVGPDGRAQEARRVARALALPMVMEQDETGSYANPAWFPHVATAAGTPTVCVEFEAAAQATARSVERGLAGMLNVMRLIGMLTDAPYRAPEQQFVARRGVFVRAEHAGLYLPEAALGSIVTVGERLGTIYSPDFAREEEVLAPVAGLLYRVSTHRPILTSERVASIAVN